jgi:hypothetical protein
MEKFDTKVHLMFKRIFVVALGLSSLYMVACASNTPVPTPTLEPTMPPPTPTSLPTAVPQDNLPGSWAVSFEYEFPPNFWSLGRHSYGYFVDCPLLMSESSGSEWYWFTVVDWEWMPEFKLPVYLRLGGLSMGLLEPITMDTIAPEWSTIAVVTVLNLSEEDAKLASTSSDCVILINWDEVFTKVLIPGEPFQP